MARWSNLRYVDEIPLQLFCFILKSLWNNWSILAIVTNYYQFAFLRFCKNAYTLHPIGLETCTQLNLQGSASFNGGRMLLKSLFHWDFNLMVFDKGSCWVADVPSCSSLGSKQQPLCFLAQPPFFKSTIYNCLLASCLFHSCPSLLPLWSVASPLHLPSLLLLLPPVRDDFFGKALYADIYTLMVTFACCVVPWPPGFFLYGLVITFCATCASHVPNV